MTQRVASAKLQYVTDQSSVATAVLASTRVLDSLQAVGTQAQSVDQQLAALGVTSQDIFTATGDKIDLGLSAPLDAADTKVKTLIRDIGTLGSEISSMPEPSLGSIVPGLGEADTGGGGIGLGGARSGLRAGAMLLGSAAGGGNLREIGQIATLTSVMGPLGIAAGISAVALKSVTEAEEARTKAAQDAADRLNAIAGDAAGGATSDAINKQISQEQTQKEALQQVQDQLQLFNSELSVAKSQLAAGTISQQEYDKVTQSLGKSVDEATGGAVTAAGGMLDLSKLLDDNQKSIDGVNVKIGGLNLELHTSAVEANNAAEAIKKLTAAQEAAASKALAIDGMTKTQRDEKAAQDLRDIDVLTRLVGAGGLTHDALVNYADQITALNDDYKAVTATSDTYADQLEREKNAKQADIDASDAINNGLKDLAAIEKQVSDASEESAKARQAVIDAETEHTAKVGEIETKRDEAIEKARMKAAQRLEQIEAASGERIRNLKENDDLSIEAAIARGDQAAAQQILAQQKLKIEQENRQADEQKAKAGSDRDDEIEAARKQARELLATEQARYDKEYQTRQQAYDKALDQERGLNAALEVQRELNAFNEIYWSGRVTAAYDLVAGRTEDFVNRMLAAGNRLFQSTGTNLTPYTETPGGSGTPFPGGGGGGLLAGFSGGGYFPPATGVQSGGGHTLMFQIDARGATMRPEEFQAVIDASLDRREVKIVRRLAQNYGT